MPSSLSQPRPLHVSHLCTNTKDEAGVTCVRLHHSLRQAGLQSTVYATNLASGDARITFPVKMDMPTEPGQTLRLSTLDRSQEMQAELMVRYPRRDNQRQMFSFLTPSFHPDKSSLPFVDIVHLHATARMTDPALASAYFQRNAVVWTLHDMNPFTGGCHDAEACEKYTQQCGACPNLASRKEEDDAYKIWRLRKVAYAGMRMRVVSPSHWMAEKARASALMGQFPVHVIPNGVPTDIYRPLNRAALRADMSISDDERVLLLPAQDLTRARKGGQAVLACLKRLRELGGAGTYRVILLGDNPPLEFLQTGLRVERPGHVEQPELLAALYNVADVLVLPSMAEHMPNGIGEALACGTPTVAYAVGAVPEMIEHERTGYLVDVDGGEAGEAAGVVDADAGADADAGDASAGNAGEVIVGNVQGLVQGVLWAAGEGAARETRRLCRVTALERWGQARCAAAYLRVYEELLAVPEGM